MQKRYVRYIVKYFNRRTARVETGIFRAADYVRDHSEIAAADKETLRQLIEWFDANLPVPEFYDDPAKRSEERHTYFWFKSSAPEFLEPMARLVLILARYGVRVETLQADEVPGALVFEDRCQIAVVPAEDVSKIR